MKLIGQSGCFVAGRPLGSALLGVRELMTTSIKRFRFNNGGPGPVQVEM